MPALPLALLAGLTLLGSLAAAPAAGQRLLAHYPFEGGALRDASGLANHAVGHGGLAPAPDRWGQPCAALHFDGRGSYLEAPASAALSAPGRAFAATAWCRLDAAPATASRWLTLLCKGEGPTETPDNPHYRVQVLQAPALGQSTVSINSDFTEYDDRFAAHPLPTATWFFFVLTYDGAFVRTYLNGRETFAFPYLGRLQANAAPLFIGRDGPGADEYFTGTLDEVRLYDDALGAAQIARLYAAPAPPPGSRPAELALSCPPRQTLPTAPGQCTATAVFALPTAATACGPATVRQVQGPPSGAAFAVGSTALAFEATGPDGSRQMCHTSVRVEDREAPQFVLPADTTLAADAADPSGAVWQFGLPIATDNCGLDKAEQVAGPVSGSRFPLGMSTVRFAATDKAGNRAECQRRVRVLAGGSAGGVAPVVAPVAAVPPVAPAAGVPPVAAPAAPAPPPVAPPVASPPLGAGRPDSTKAVVELAFNSCLVTLLAYDGFDEDGDSVSVYFNGREIVAKQVLRAKARGPIVRQVLLEPGLKNTFVVKAWNIGRPGTPNTLKVEFFEGYYPADVAWKLLRRKPIHAQTLYALPGLSGSLLLTCKNR